MQAAYPTLFAHCSYTDKKAASSIYPPPLDTQNIRRSHYFNWQQRNTNQNSGGNKINHSEIRIVEYKSRLFWFVKLTCVFLKWLLMVFKKKKKSINHLALAVICHPTDPHLLLLNRLQMTKFAALIMCKSCLELSLGSQIVLQASIRIMSSPDRQLRNRTMQQSQMFFNLKRCYLESKPEIWMWYNSPHPRSSFIIFLPLTRKLFSITFGTLAAINLPLDACSLERKEEHVHAHSHVAQSRDYFQA